MNERELAIIKTVSETFGEALSSLQESFAKQLDVQRQAFEERFSQLNKSLQEIVDSPDPDLSTIAREAAAMVPAPEIPELPDIDAMVASAVQALPAPAPGKSISPEDVQPMLEQMVKDAVAEIQPPELPDVSKMVNEAVAGLPAPENGKSITEEDVKPMLERLVNEAVSGLPVPAVPELPDINALVTAAVQALPEPEPSKNGTDGRDALQLEVSPFIDEEKSYPRGSYATHSGGLWRAYEKTHGMRGWECLVDGVSGIDVANTDERNFTITVTRASGRVEAKSFTIPALIYRGVFKSGNVYQPGDTVTWGGSMWHCDEESTDKPGENGSKGWTLATKRGRDGRDKT
ncbi:phage gp6-like head-tail connector protein [Cedecea davisae]|uniref:phage gp6-like head-tail connector protein n=1 Tax=Cedecea davisae TaxID=158484 RepID=UPI00243299D3|nr:phage gp6-like head-tail connector protein [Cedecea davisae]